ncbi:hypothetical protein [Streptomyces sp. NPDC001292]|uniref:hypothetical protein n=1 Tax=Streptomyces sp. NPDC001292 TaxID=3364558 RepID=UPI00369DD35C
MTPSPRLSRRTLLVGAATVAAAPMLTAPAAAAASRDGHWSLARYRGLCADDFSVKFSMLKVFNPWMKCTLSPWLA